MALPYIRSELQLWLDAAVYLARRSHDPRSARYGVREKTVSFDEDLFSTISETVEDLFSDAEIKARLQTFLDSLTDSERQLLVGGLGAGRGRTNSPRAHGYYSLVERATAFVREDDGRATAAAS